MKERVYEYLKENPGARKRDIANELHIWVCDKYLSNILYELLHEGRVFRRLHRDPANMEFYDKWYMVEE